MRQHQHSVLSMIPEHILNEVTERLVSSTNMSVGIMDFQGNIKTFQMGEISCDLCRKRRMSGHYEIDCCRTDACAGIEASRKGDTYIYVCRYGLVDMAAPIIAEGEYIGTIFLGQVYTEEAHMKTLPHVMPFDDEISREEYKVMYPKYLEERDKVPIIPYETLKKYASMEQFAAKYLSAVYTVQKKMQLLESKENQLELKERDAMQRKDILEKTEVSNMVLRTFPEFMLNIMNALNQFAILEEAPQTLMIIQKLTACLRKSLTVNSHMATLREEIELLKDFQAIQKTAYQNVKMILNIHTEHFDCMLPRACLFAIAANCYQHAFTAGTRNACIRVDIEDSSDKLHINISDNGKGMPHQVYTELLSYWHSGEEKNTNQKGSLILLMHSLKTYYQNQCLFDIRSQKNGGTLIEIEIDL